VLFFLTRCPVGAPKQLCCKVCAVVADMPDMKISTGFLVLALACAGHFLAIAGLSRSLAARDTAKPASPATTGKISVAHGPHPARNAGGDH
jgi:hypothetical protein